MRPDRPAPRSAARRLLVPLAVVAIGYLALLFALRLAHSAPDAVAGPPTCKGRPLSEGATCEQTRREFVGRTGRVSWYTEVEEVLSSAQVAARQAQDARLARWGWAMVVGTAGTITILGGTALLLENRRPRTVAFLGSVTLLPLLAATAFVGWSELRFEPDDRPALLGWRSPEAIPASAAVMLGLVATGGTMALGSAVRPDERPAAQEPRGLGAPVAVRGPTFAGYPLASWWRRVLARLIDLVIIWISVFVLSLIVAVITFVAGRPLLGEETAASVMTWGTLVLSFLVAFGYDLQNGGKDDDTPGKRALKLRVVAQNATSVTQGVPDGAVFVRALAWWAPIFLAMLATTGFPLTRPLLSVFGPVPYLGEVPYAWLLLLLPVLNGAWPLWDRRLRQSLNDRLAKTVVVRTG